MQGWFTVRKRLAFFSKSFQDAFLQALQHPFLTKCMFLILRHQGVLWNGRCLPEITPHLIPKLHVYRQMPPNIQLTNWIRILGNFEWNWNSKLQFDPEAVEVKATSWFPLKFLFILKDSIKQTRISSFEINCRIANLISWQAVNKTKCHSCRILTFFSRYFVSNS